MSLVCALRPLVGAVLAGLLLAGPVLAEGGSYLPAGFLDAPVIDKNASAQVDADRLTYDGASNTISAEGDVRMAYNGYVITADRLTFNQKTQEVEATGNVSVKDPSGDTLQMDTLKVTGGMKEAFVKSLALTTPQGSTITADDVHYGETLETILTNGTYSPCGLCIDSKGRRIGWNVKAARIIYNREGGYVILEQPSVAVLGVPVAWFPWLAFPDPTQPRRNGVRFPSVGYGTNTGVKLAVPYFIGIGEDTDIMLTPTLFSAQGFLMAAEWEQRFPGLGQIDIKASGLYQFNPGAFAGAPWETAPGAAPSRPQARSPRSRTGPQAGHTRCFRMPPTCRIMASRMPRVRPTRPTSHISATTIISTSGFSSSSVWATT